MHDNKYNDFPAANENNNSVYDIHNIFHFVHNTHDYNYTAFSLHSHYPSRVTNATVVNNNNNSDNNNIL